MTEREVFLLLVSSETKFVEKPTELVSVPLKRFAPVASIIGQNEFFLFTDINLWGSPTLVLRFLPRGVQQLKILFKADRKSRFDTL